MAKSGSSVAPPSRPGAPRTTRTSIASSFMSETMAIASGSPLVGWTA